MKYTRQQRIEAYKKLSEDVQYFASSQETSESISKIFVNFGLSTDLSETLTGETYFAMLGLQTFDELVRVIEKQSNQPTSKVLEIAADLNKNIFKKIEELKKSTANTPSIKATELPKKTDTLKPLLDEGNEHLIMAPVAQNIRSGEPKPAEPTVTTLHEAVMPEIAALTATESPEVLPGPSVDTSHVHIPDKNAVEAKLAELKKLPESGVLEKKYPGVDPYREPIG